MDFELKLSENLIINFNLIEVDEHLPSYYYTVNIISLVSGFESSSSISLWFMEDELKKFFNKKESLTSMSNDFQLEVSNSTISLKLSFNYFNKHCHDTKILLNFDSLDHVYPIINKLDDYSLF